ncbi:MAG: GNAT family N-acetyltransferase [Gloeobacteraceae cyanobacterium ES-bin-316]|nr:GNAT family N-acetyltransferase [Ferruginibacter sp.]
MQQKFPLLKTERLLLREILQEDIPLVFKGLSHPDVIKQFGVSYKTLEATQEQMDWYANMLKNDNGRCWAICSKDNTIFYGVCTLNFWKKEHRKAETGYWIFPEFWGKGIVSEAMRRVIAFGFEEMQLHRISAEVEDDNPASIAVLKKLGFEHEGTLRACEIKEGRFINLEIYAILNERS